VSDDASDAMSAIDRDSKLIARKSRNRITLRSELEDKDTN